MGKTLGLDFGHCEVAVSLTMDGRKPENLILDDNKAKVIPAQIALTQDQIQSLTQGKACRLRDLGKVAIGDAAAPINDENSDLVTFMYFKKAPAFFEELVDNKISRGALMAVYLYQLMEQILEHNPDYLDPSDRENLELLVGCPTTEEWTGETAAAKYADLIRKATGVRSVQIVPESRAAMFSSIESTQSSISAAGGAIVFDFGSSTADCTYMLLGSCCFEYSWRLGAQAIEAQMAKVAFAGQKPSLASRVYVTNQLRKQKELYYSGHFGPKGQRLFYDVQSLNGKDIEAYIRINEDQMDEIVSGEDHEIEILCDSTRSEFGTWRSLCLGFFKAAKDILEEKELPCESIVLTGGASKMPFVPACCQKVFGDSAKIYVERNPSLSVANGLGWVSTIDSRVPDVVKETVEVIKQDESVNLDLLMKSISTRIHKIVADVMEAQMNIWVEGSHARPLSELVEMTSQQMNTSEVQENIRDAVETEVKQWTDRCMSVVQENVNQYASKLMTQKMAKGVVLRDDVWSRLTTDKLFTGDINVERMINKLDMTSLLGKIAKAVVAVVMLSIAAGMGPLGLAIAAVILLGGGLDFMSDTNMTKPRDQSFRIKLKNKIPQEINKPENVAKIATSVEESMMDLRVQFPEILEMTVRNAFEIITLKRFDS